MPFDAIVTRALQQELSEKLMGSRITKVYQPNTHLVTFLCRRPGKNWTLAVRIDPESSGVYLSSSSYVNPEVPSSFCMLLRKHLENGRIVEIAQPGFERIITLRVETLDDFGRLADRVLIAEIMGRYSNLVLLDENQVILDAARRVTHEVNRVRELIPGIEYMPPPPQEKADPTTIPKDSFYNLLYPASRNIKMANLLVGRLAGLSPLSAREIVYRAGKSPDASRGDFDGDSFNRLWETVRTVFDEVKKGLFSPSLVLDEGLPVDYCALHLSHLPEQRTRTVRSMSEALEEVVEAKALASVIRRTRSELIKVVDTNLSRVRRKIKEQEATLAEAENADQYRIMGELLTASLHLVKPGDREAAVPNYYSADEELITIPLDPARSPAANAQAYFRKYAKLKKSVSVTASQLEKSIEEEEYLNQVAASVDIAGEIADLEEIRRELTEQGYIKAGRKSRRTPQKSSPERFVSSDGFEILAGKNNRQNDMLTLHTAKPSDLWFHTKEIPGAHVIVRTDGKDVPPKTLEEAAMLAAWYSKARGSSKVPVDYTERRHVRKLKGARPGMVIYDNHQTILVDPEESVVLRLRRKADTPGK